MRIEIESDVLLNVTASAEVSSDENASALVVTVRVKDGNGTREINITGALSDGEKALLLIAIEDQYRQAKQDEADFGKGEAV